jgi:hypothetical protein
MAALALGHAVVNDVYVTVALPALAKALSDKDEQLRENVVDSLTDVIGRCTSAEQVNLMETKLREEYDALRKKQRYLRGWEVSGIAFVLSKYIIERAKRRDELAPQHDILLDDIPKPPKKGGVYQEIRRVRNG